SEDEASGRDRDDRDGDPDGRPASGRLSDAAAPQGRPRRSRLVGRLGLDSHRAGDPVGDGDPTHDLAKNSLPQTVREHPRRVSPAGVLYESSVCVSPICGTVTGQPSSFSMRPARILAGSGSPCTRNTRLGALLALLSQRKRPLASAWAEKPWMVSTLASTGTSSPKMRTVWAPS